MNKFLAQYASHHIRQGQFKETARTLSRYNSPAFEGMLPAYKTIAQDVLQSDNDIELQNLREMLQKLVKNLETAVGDRNSPVYQEFLRYLTITHLLLLKSECTRNNLNRVTAKLATSLLRYCKDIRADKAFLDAGNACRAVNQNDMAFIFFNRYIDLWDLIVDPDANMIPESGEFEGTDIPAPYDIPLPEKNLLSEADRDQIRDWVLQINMDGGVGEALPTRVCEFCGYEHVYEASLKCPQCQNGWEPCIISGYPLIRSQAIHCKFCNMGALRDMWNDYVGVTQHCPWCNSMQTPY